MKRKTKIFWMLLALGLGLFALGRAGCATAPEAGVQRQDAAATPEIPWPDATATPEVMHAAYVDAYGPNIRDWPEEAQRAWREAFEKAEV